VRRGAAPGTGRRADASLPPPGLAGLDPAWSRLVETDDADGVRRTWHVLDTAAAHGRDGGSVGTLLCVHGNPTWSYLWRDLVARGAEAGWRVVAVDQLDMGFSERTGTARGLARRIDDLGRLTDALELSGPVVTVAHDWGGPISLGWALAHRAQLAGVVLTNTAVHQPTGSPAPALIRLARSPGVLPTVTVRTPVFLRGTLALSRHPRLPADVRAGYLAPYASPGRRRAIGRFVADIPLSPEHPSWAPLQKVAEGLEALADVPALMLWGPGDPVFGDRYLRDLRARLPQAAVHRFEGASHLVPEDADVAGAVLAWLTAPPFRGDHAAVHRPPGEAGRVSGRRGLWAALEERAGDPATAVVEMAPAVAAGRRVVSWALLERRVRDLAAGLATCGVGRGDRVALLVPPGADLTAAVYACWRAGAVVVLADAGLGIRGLHRALRGAAPDHIVAVPRGLAAACTLGWTGQRIAAGAVGRTTLRALGARLTLADVARRGAGAPLREPPGADDVAAVLFTSGATGAAKGVVYRHGQLEAQRETLAATYGIGPQDRLVAAFAPFALYGPALGVPSVVPDMDVTAPRTLTAKALADAASAVGATLVFSSPAALVTVLATGNALDDAARTSLRRVRLLLSAGAPVPADLLRRVRALMPAASAHTPYGMTEALPVADVKLDEVEKAGAGNGVCVGRPVDGVELALSPLAADGTVADALTTTTDVTGEICVRAGHVKDHYDQLWVTERASVHEGWHRSGDVGHLDAEGRLWVEGRLSHVILTSSGFVTPVGLEQRVETVPEVRLAAAVGVGPPGVEQVVLVVETGPTARRAALAPLRLADDVRRVAGVDVAAVLAVPALPVDIRHNSKIDRARVARWAAGVLAGGRIPRRVR
jgi:acyl-CoA synthetase (AMP-forming)/AMP-acid ligase II/pimeloyl-ACP methyl ester carboxylesterase